MAGSLDSSIGFFFDEPTSRLTTDPTCIHSFSSRLEGGGFYLCKNTPQNIGCCLKVSCLVSGFNREGAIGFSHLQATRRSRVRAGEALRGRSASSVDRRKRSRLLRASKRERSAGPASKQASSSTSQGPTSSAGPHSSHTNNTAVCTHERIIRRPHLLPEAADQPLISHNFNVPPAAGYARFGSRCFHRLSGQHRPEEVGPRRSGIRRADCHCKSLSAKFLQQSAATDATAATAATVVTAAAAAAANAAAVESMRFRRALLLPFAAVATAATAAAPPAFPSFADAAGPSAGEKVRQARGLLLLRRWHRGKETRQQQTSTVFNRHKSKANEKTTTQECSSYACTRVVKTHRRR